MKVVLRQPRREVKIKGVARMSGLLAKVGHSAETVTGVDKAALHQCQLCGEPTTGDICSFCRLQLATIATVGRR